MVMREQALVSSTEKMANTQFIRSSLLVEKDDESQEVGDTKTTKQSALELFSDLSLQLTESYSMLESRVSDLTSELNSVSEQRIVELKDKEKIAKRLENLISFLPGGVVVLDNRGVIVESNPAAEELLEENIIGQRWINVIQQCFSPRTDDGHEVSNRKGKRINITTRSLGKDGQIILLTDQTETRELQAQLSRHERLTALGKMVSTLAHQVRTPLSSAILYGSHLLETPLDDNKRQQFTKKLVNRLHEMERQVQDMLLFVKPELMIRDVISVNYLQSILDESMSELFKQNHIDYQWHVDIPKIQVTCNKDALVGALTNLLHNSVQAMHESSSTKNILSICFTQDENNLVIMIEDNGGGISDDNKTKIHDLFETTKPQGTGIGLSVVHSVVKAHGGTFSLVSPYKEGACATIRLPIITNNNDC